MIEQLDFMTTEDVMRLLKVQRRTILGLIHAGELSAIRINQKCYRFRREEVERYLRAKLTQDGKAKK